MSEINIAKDGAVALDGKRVLTADEKTAEAQGERATAELVVAYEAQNETLSTTDDDGNVWMLPLPSPYVETAVAVRAHAIAGNPEKIINAAYAVAEIVYILQHKGDPDFDVDNINPRDVRILAQSLTPQAVIAYTALILAALKRYIEVLKNLRSRARAGLGTTTKKGSPSRSRR